MLGFKKKSTKPTWLLTSALITGAAVLGRALGKKILLEYTRLKETVWLHCIQ